MSFPNSEPYPLSAKIRQIIGGSFACGVGQVPHQRGYLMILIIGGEYVTEEEEATTYDPEETAKAEADLLPSGGLISRLLWANRARSLERRG